MHVFVWSYVNYLTDNYHSGGGLFVVAKSLEDARALIVDAVPNNCSALSDEPTHQYELFDDLVEPTYEIFPDAGCC